ncbi:MAG: xanthine dehydrogenase family protein molybdopterin-binding subunit, partial [Nannocystaceae bacterium]
QVQVLAPYVGGGFGGKAVLALEMVAAVELSRAASRPVRVVLDRHEELTVGGNRPAQDLDVALASDAQGKFTGLRAISHGDAGVAVGSAPSILFRIMYADTPKQLEDWDVITHAAPGKPLRGPGGPPAFWALEQSVDALAYARGEDPIALRRKNDPNPARKELYTWAEQLPVWRNRAPTAGNDRGRFRRGTGLAVGGWFYFVQPSARVQVDTTPGGLVVSTACQDMGNGSRSVLAAAVAEVFGIDPGMVVVRIGDSKLVPGPMSGGSRTATTLAPAATAAALDIREELLEIAEAQLGYHGAQATRGGIRHTGGEASWAEILARAPRLTTVGRRKRDRRGYFFALGGLAAGRYIGGSVQVSEVEVDTRLGTV